MHTELVSSIQRFMLHCNDAVISLCLNNRSRYQDEDDYYDSTAENTHDTYQQLEKHFQQFQAAIKPLFDKATAKQISVIMAIYADETILTSGLYYSGYLWTKLQKADLGKRDGGNVFFEYCDELFAMPDNDTPPVIYELLQHCLENGFKGRHYNKPQALTYYKTQLSLRIDELTQRKQNTKVRAIHEYA
jgi:type VI protein secretion system component VasF